LLQVSGATGIQLFAQAIGAAGSWCLLADVTVASILRGVKQSPRLLIDIPVSCLLIEIPTIHLLAGVSRMIP